MPLTAETVKSLATWAGNDKEKQSKAYRLVTLDSWGDMKEALGLLQDAGNLPDKVVDMVHKLLTYSPEEFDEHVREVFDRTEIDNTVVIVIRRIKKDVCGQNSTYNLEENYKRRIG